jgi:hypothetical protein
MRVLQLTVFVAVLVAVSGCGKSEYWVKGLTLPPGATVSSKTETTKLEGQAAMMPMMGQIDNMLVVSFECPGGWQAVSSHIDQCMKAQGYADTMSGVSSMMAGMPGGDALSGMRYYTKSGAKYAVMVQDFGGMMDKFGGGKIKAGSVPGMASFNMSVMKFK